MAENLHIMSAWILQNEGERIQIFYAESAFFAIRFGNIEKKKKKKIAAKEFLSRMMIFYWSTISIGRESGTTFLFSSLKSKLSA